MKIITKFLNKNLKILFIFFVFFSVTQCSSSMKLEQFQNNKPVFKLEEYFKGKTVARGVFEDQVKAKKALSQRANRKSKKEHRIRYL